MSKNPFMRTPFTDMKDVDDMSKNEAGKEIELLREAIEHHDYQYYIKNDPDISDNKYDQLFNRLIKLEEKFPDFDSDVSPTKKVGASPVDELKKKKHVDTMLSLNSSNREEDVRDFISFVREKADNQDIDFFLEPKLDGLSVEVVYEKGVFSYGATRGDGKTGEDISENVKTINSLPLKLKRNKKFPEFISVRGEIYISKEGFQDLNKKRIENGQEPFANARNAAAGMVRQLDPQKVADKPLDIFFYEIIYSNIDKIESHRDVLKQFSKWGLRINHENKKCNKLEEITDFHESLGNKRDELSYEIDGIVIKLDDRKLREKLGTRDRSPRWAFAWKFEPQKEITVLRDIIVQVGRTGILTPVALLDPVEVGGVTVSRATLHNEDEVKKKDVRPGDKVRVIRAGDVIPEVAERVEKQKGKRGKPFKMPEKCPVCNTGVVREGAYVVCPAGLSCKAQLKGSLSHFASRDGMNIENLGDKIIEELVERGMVENIPDLYHLEAGDLKKLEGFAEKSSKKLYDAIQSSKSVRLSVFLYSLGIRHVGKHVARVLAGKYGSLDEIAGANYQDLENIPEIGPEIAESISNFFDNKDNLRMIDELKKSGVKIRQEESTGSKTLDGKTFVLTGELEGLTRSQAEEKIESLGGRATSGVSDNTDYLVKGKDPGSKLDEARKRKVKIIDEKQFKKMIS
ncbi:MAG: NAD-dependent DNA ligase LigA [Bacteroidota bacterium]